MRRLPTALTAAVLATLPLTGCADDRPPVEGQPPVRVVDGPYVNAPAKPMPPIGPLGPDLPPAFADPALVTQQTPEQQRYVAAYAAVGQPKLIVFVNRTVTGELVPVSGGRPEVTSTSTGYGQTTTTLRPGQYDEADAKGIDYELIENLLSDTLSGGGRVTMIAPVAARQRLSDAEVSEIQSGRPQMLGELATKLNADVFVQVTARPSRQTAQGLGVRLVAQALNTANGQAVAFAAVDVPPPLTKPQLNEYTRFVARKLMDGMSASWETLSANDRRPMSNAGPGQVTTPAVPPRTVPPMPTATVTPPPEPAAVPPTPPATSGGPLMPATSRPGDLLPPP